MANSSRPPNRGWTRGAWALTLAVMVTAVAALIPARSAVTAEAQAKNGVAAISVPRGVNNGRPRSADYARKRGFSLVLRSEFLGTDSRPFAVRSEDLPTFWRRDAAGVAYGHDATDVPLMYEIHNPYAKRVYQPYNLLALVGVWFPLCHLDAANWVSHVELLTPMDGTSGYVGLYKTSILRSMTPSAMVPMGARDRLYECVALRPNDDEAELYIRRNFRKACDVGVGHAVFPFCPKPAEPELRSKSLKARVADTGRDAHVFIRGQRSVQKVTYLSNQNYRMFEIDFARKVVELNGRSWFTPLEVARGAVGEVPTDLIDPLLGVLGDELYRFVSGLQRLLPAENLKRMKIKVPECTDGGPIKVSIRYTELAESIELIETEGDECYRIHRK